MDITVICNLSIMTYLVLVLQLNLYIPYLSWVYHQEGGTINIEAYCETSQEVGYTNFQTELCLFIVIINFTQ